MYYELSDHFEVSADADKTWEFFSRAENLPHITPPWLSFRILNDQPIKMHRGTRIDYTIAWLGVPIRWRTRIIDWTPKRQFIDLQIKGPYTLWHHLHTFEPAQDGGTICRDVVTYKVPFGPMGTLTHSVMIRKQLLEIFRFRRKAIRHALGWKRALQPDVRIKRLG